MKKRQKEIDELIQKLNLMIKQERAKDEIDAVIKELKKLLEEYLGYNS